MPLRPLLALVLTLLFAAPVLADEAEITGPVGADVSPIETLTVQDRQVLKTFDTFARQRLSFITGKTRLGDASPTWTVLDIVFRPAAYLERPIIKVHHLPLRLELAKLPGLDADEAERIKREGTVSAAFLADTDVQQAMQQLQAADLRRAEPIGRLDQQRRALDELLVGGGMVYPPGRLVPPGNGVDSTIWLGVAQLEPNLPELAAAQRVLHGVVGDVQPGFEQEQVRDAIEASLRLSGSWRSGDEAGVTEAIETLAAVLPAMNADRYPSDERRTAELWYNKLGKGTLIGAAIYFTAFTLLLLRGVTDRRWFGVGGLVVLVGGLLVHTAAIGVRWWLVEKSTGDWALSIPIKNQFESVLMSAWFGGVVGLALELWRRNGFFGAAASFVGGLSLIALFTVPYVFGKEIGGEITQAGGILMTFWLYIHVTLVVFSYALIGMTFILGVTWGVAKLAGAGRPLLGLIDSSNLVLLQLAFWVLGVGIVTGAYWADVSWGRPWGWDPKETFALVTWIVYLIIVHVRFVTPNKAAWTAGLSIVGFFVMLFNWIGVNFFLVGLHSYA